MLEHISIENLILVRRASIDFGEGLNILTGETGSGKSAILTAIRLLCGEKADPQMIRCGVDLAIVEGRVRLRNKVDVVRRELHRSGKSRAFFNDQLISLTSLRKLLSGSIELADQNSARNLSIPSFQRELVDLWAGLDVCGFAQSYSLEQTLASTLLTLKTEKEKTELSLTRAASDLEEIEEINWKENEDAQLSDEHHRLSSTAERLEHISAVHQELSEGSPPLAAQLRRLAIHLEQADLKDAAELLQSASIEVFEAEKIVQTALDHQEDDPGRLSIVESRIGAIERLKRRFGGSYEEVAALKQSLIAKINRLDQLDEKLQTVEKELQTQAMQNRALATQISQRRKDAASDLQTRLATELHQLNLPHARFEARLEPKEMGPDGIDKIRFFFSANPGQPLLALEECASGGEQSRLLLAFKVLFADKENYSCLIFDEIDSNVGGQTASILGQKLQLLAKLYQVICVTHFVQVARCASHHFLVAKQSEDGLALTSIEKLDERSCDIEYSRMIGSENFIPALAQSHSYSRDKWTKSS